MGTEESQAKPVTDLQLIGSTSDEEMPRRNQRITDYQRRIGIALASFMETCPPAVRVGLGDFEGCIRWSKNRLLMPVPRRAQRHKQDATRCASNSKYVLADFHVADAIQILHVAMNHISHPLLWTKAITGLGWRVRLLEGLARVGLDHTYVDGSESTGYKLVDHPSSVKTRDYAPIFGNTNIGKEPPDKKEGGYEDGKNLDGEQPT